MPFLQQGNSAVVTVPAGQSIAIGAPVDSVANVLIPLGQPGGPSSTVAGITSQVFGPYPNGATITVVSAKGQVEYVVGPSPVAGAIIASTYTWLALPLPSAYIGAAYVSDVGLSGSLWYSNGVTWGLVGGDAVLARGNADINVTGGSTSEEDLVSITIPAGLMGVNGQLEVTHFWEATNNANVKTMRVKLGGTAFFANATAINSNAIFLPPPTRIWNRNSQSSQMAFAAANGNTTIATGTAKTTGTVDTSAATTLAISGQKATGADTLTLIGYVVRLIRP